MKYKLKKDLPFAKTGDIVNYKDGIIYFDSEVRLSPAPFCCNLPYQRRDEWIEEVKPRERY